VVTLFRVGVDGRPAIHQRVEEGKRAGEPESLRPQLQDQERRIACRLNVDGDELGVLQPCARRQLGRINGDLLPRYRLHCAARLEKDLLGSH
jgi:hypothetical protein